LTFNIFHPLFYIKVYINFRISFLIDTKRIKKWVFGTGVSWRAHMGVVDLSVPLVKGRGQKTLVRDVRISERQPWAAQHWKTIVSCYSRSPWFDHYRDELEGLFRRQLRLSAGLGHGVFRLVGPGVGVGDPGWVDGKVGYRSIRREEAVDWRGRVKTEGSSGGVWGGRERSAGRAGFAGKDWGLSWTCRSWHLLFE
jgi:hypothetical protein